MDSEYRTHRSYVEKSLKKVLTKQMLCYKISFVVSEIITHNNVWAYLSWIERLATDQKVGSSNLLAHVLEPVGVCLQVFLCNKPSCRNRACTNFYRTANVHRADRRDGIDCTFEQTIGCSSIA